MKTLATIVTLIAIMAGCTRCSKPKQYEQFNDIVKGSVIFPDRMEGTPVVFNDKLIYVISSRNATSVGNEKIEFYNESKKLINTINTNSDLISALVYEGELYIFKTVDRKHIDFIKTSDLKIFTQPIRIMSAPEGHNYYNTSVAIDDDGFVMAYETCEPDTVCFNVRFAKSSDLESWQDAGTIYSPNKYAACPSIRFLDGVYYLTYLDHTGSHYRTMITRSTDLRAWDAPVILITPEDNYDTNSINNSDLDYVEHNGRVLFQYAEGNQSSGSDAFVYIREAIYEGTEKELYEYLFN